MTQSKLMTETKWNWFERRFSFDFPPEKMPDIIERLRGTPLRASQLVDGLSDEVLKARDGETWSIQENVAHIPDVESLWLGRIDDILGGQKEMRAADLTNRKTFEGNHHDKSINEVLTRVQTERQVLIDRLESLTPEQWALSSSHPRLEAPMRMIDLTYFVADHDDYHLARISFLKRTLEQ